MPPSVFARDLEAAGCWSCRRHDPMFPVGLRDAPWAELRGWFVGWGNRELAEKKARTGLDSIRAIRGGGGGDDRRQ